MNYTLRLPDYYKKEIEALKGNTSINQFIVNAVAEKGSRAHALSMLDQVSNNL